MDNVKATFIKKISQELNIPESIIEITVNFQFNSVIEALSEYREVELTGFGKFVFQDKKGIKELALVEKKRDFFLDLSNNPDKPEKERKKAEVIVFQEEKRIKYLTHKLNGNRQDL